MTTNKLSNVAYTILYSVMGVGSVISALVFANRTTVNLKHIIIGAATLGVTMLLLALSPNMFFATPAVLLVGATSIIYSTATTAMAQLESAPHIRGRILALQTILLVGTTPIGGPLLGWLSDIYGGRLPILIGGIAGLCAAIFGYIAARSLVKKTVKLT